MILDAERGPAQKTRPRCRPEARGPAQNLRPREPTVIVVPRSLRRRKYQILRWQSCHAQSAVLTFRFPNFARRRSALGRNCGHTPPYTHPDFWTLRSGCAIVRLPG